MTQIADCDTAYHRNDLEHPRNRSEDTVSSNSRSVEFEHLHNRYLRTGRGAEFMVPCHRRHDRSLLFVHGCCSGQWDDCAGRR